MIAIARSPPTRARNVANHLLEPGTSENMKKCTWPAKTANTAAMYAVAHSFTPKILNDTNGLNIPVKTRLRSSARCRDARVLWGRSRFIAKTSCKSMRARFTDAAWMNWRMDNVMRFLWDIHTLISLDAFHVYSQKGSTAGEVWFIFVKMGGRFYCCLFACTFNFCFSSHVWVDGW